MIMADMDDKNCDSLGQDEWFGDSTPEDTDYWLTAVAEKATGAERRQDMRTRVNIAARVSPGARGAIAGDLSLTGILLYSDAPLSPSSHVTLSLHTLCGLAEAKGVIRWVSKNNTSDYYHSKHCMGIEFTWVSLVMKELLVK
jgi:hypothetical protein